MNNYYKELLNYSLKNNYLTEREVNELATIKAFKKTLKETYASIYSSVTYDGEL